jgi:ankyrin repeat protein
LLLLIFTEVPFSNNFWTITTDPLFTATKKSLVSSLAFLMLDSCAAIVNNGSSSNGLSGLMVAAQNSDMEMLRFLMKAGANLNATQTTGWTPLLYAVYGGNADVVKELIMNNAAVSPRMNDQGWTALMLATYQEYEDIAQLLLDNGADPNEQDQEGWTTLMIAANKGNINIVKSLLEKGVDVNAKDSEE